MTNVIEIFYYSCFINVLYILIKVIWDGESRLGWEAPVIFAVWSIFTFIAGYLEGKRS